MLKRNPLIKIKSRKIGKTICGTIFSSNEQADKTTPSVVASDSGNTLGIRFRCDGDELSEEINDFQKPC